MQIQRHLQGIRHLHRAPLLLKEEQRLKELLPLNLAEEKQHHHLLQQTELVQQQLLEIAIQHHPTLDPLQQGRQPHVQD